MHGLLTGQESRPQLYTSWSRVAITDDQVRECGLAPVWKVDNRHRPARDHEAWEAEALGQARSSSWSATRWTPCCPSR
jgi:hypothetical protein